MRAVVCRRFGPVSELTVEERPDPDPGPGQVSIEVAACGVNFVDALFVQGRYQIKPPLPFTPGMEVAGTVVATGEGVMAPAPGDRVMAMPWMGGYASQVVAPAASVLPLPAGLTPGQGATVIQSYATSLFALTVRSWVQPDEWVLVLGAGGGVGLAATEVATALGGRVIAAASTPEKLASARRAGAVETVDYGTEDLKARVREITAADGRKGADVVVDPVGGALAEPALRATGWAGRYLVIGFAAGDIPRLAANQVLLNNRTVVGVDWGAWVGRHPEENRELVERLLDMVGTGEIHPVEPVAYPLERVGDALADLEQRHAVGKLVLVP